MQFSQNTREILVKICFNETSGLLPSNLIKTTHSQLVLKQVFKGTFASCLQDKIISIARTIPSQ